MKCIMNKTLAAAALIAINAFATGLAAQEETESKCPEGYYACGFNICCPR